MRFFFKARAEIGNAVCGDKDSVSQDVGKKCQFFQKLTQWFLLKRDVFQGVCGLDFYSDSPSSNPTEANSFLTQICAFIITKIKEKRLGFFEITTHDPHSFLFFSKPTPTVVPATESPMQVGPPSSQPSRSPS